MASERDPRLDPRPGDVLAKGESKVHVCRAGISDFGYSFEGNGKDMPPMVHWSDDWRPSWRKWAANAKIIQRAEGSTDAQ